MLRNWREYQKGRRITGEDRKKLAFELKKAYEKGSSVRALAEETGRSYGFVHRVLTDQRLTLRPRGGNTRAKKGKR